MEYISLLTVKLKSGTWEQVLLELCKLPHLLDVDIDYSGYSAGGSSSHLDQPLPSQDQHLQIETSQNPDWGVLGDLERRVNSNRIAMGLQPFGDGRYRHMDVGLEF